MGNHKFRLSDMMPNAWFYKLKYMGNRINNSSSAATHYSNHQKKKKKTKQSTPNLLQNPRQTCSRKSYYFTRDNTTSSPIHPTSLSAHSKSSSIDSLFPDPPTTYKHAKISPNTSASEYNYPSSLVCPPSSLEMRSDRALPTESFEEKVSWSSSCNYEPRSIVIDIDGNKQLAAKIENSEDFVTIFDLELRPILTKQKLADNTSRGNNKFKSQQDKKPNSPNNSEAESRQSVSKRVQGMKLRVNSPRIGSKRFPANGRRSLSSSSSSSSSKKSALAESLAIVKRSVNPQEDFKQSMVEMIVEHEIRSSKDLEELLACYLSLNSDEYHDLIISVFKQIWFQLSGLHNNETN